VDDKALGFKVEESKRQSWISLAAVWIGAMVCVPCLMVGGYLSMGFPISGILVCTLIGYGIICAYMCLMGMQGCDTGLPTAPMATSALGENGARFIISAILAIACIGWFGVQAAVCGSSFSSMMLSMTGLNIPVWLSSIFWGAIMLLTACFGFNAVKYLNYIAIPALVLVLGYAAFAALFRNDGISAIANYKPSQPMTLVAGINLAVATFAVGGVISADFSRFAKNRKDVVKSTVFGVFPAGLVMLMLGASASIVAGEYDISVVLTNLGLPAFGLIALILSTWTTNVTNAYSGGLALTNLLGFPEKKFRTTTAIAGSVGTILAAVGIMTRFQDFLSILTSFVPPVAGVVIASYWIVGKGEKENFKFVKGVNIAGVISFAAGAAVAYITANVFSFFVGPINGIIVSMVLYIILIKALPVKESQLEAVK
jgi:cytosine permease